MKNLNLILFLPFVCLLFLSSINTSLALTIAIFPFDDLSEGRIRLELDLSNYIAKEISEKGITIVPDDKILSFMASERIRELGTLQARHILQAREKLAADLILLGSITQLRSSPSAIGLTLSLIRTTDAKTVWSNSKGVSVDDQLRVLAIGQPESISDLYPLLRSNILASWPDDLDFSAGNSLAGIDIASASDASLLQIDSIMFTPKYVKPGDEVKCFIKFRGDNLTTSAPKVYVKVGSKVYLASSDDGVYFQTSWVGGVGQQHKRVKVAMATTESKMFRGVIESGNIDASYPITLVVDWLGRRNESFIGTYVVDSQPPEIKLKTGGKIINGVASFSQSMPLFVQWSRKEPISHWQLSVRDGDGKKIFQYKGRGSCPNSLFWNGKNQNKVRVAPGKYVISLDVFDRAGNKGSAEEKVALISGNPEIELNLVEKRKNEFNLDINYAETIPLVSWRLELWSKDNHLLELKEGSSLPSSVFFKLAAPFSEEKIQGLVVVQDIFGQISKKEIKNVLALSQKKEECPPEEKDPNQWQSDF